MLNFPMTFWKTFVISTVLSYLRVLYPVLSTVKINIFFGRYLATEQGSLPFLVNPPKCMYFYTSIGNTNGWSTER